MLVHCLYLLYCTIGMAPSWVYQCYPLFKFIGISYEDEKPHYNISTGQGYVPSGDILLLCVASITGQVSYGLI